MVSVIFAVLEVSFWAFTTAVKLPWKFLTLIFAVLLPFFAARCYTSAALAVMRCPSVCLPVCLSRSYMHSVKTNKHICKFFSPFGSHTILIFPYRTSQQYSDGNPPTQRGRRMHVGRQKLGFWPNIWHSRILWTLRRPAAINTIVGRYPAIDRCCLLELVLYINWRWFVHGVVYHSCHGASLFMAQKATPRTIEYSEEKRT